MIVDTPGHRLKWARERHGQYGTPTAAAVAFGWKVSTYLGHENGDRNPSRGAAKRYARAYRVRWEWLLDGEGEPEKTSLPIRVIGEVRRFGLIYFYVQETVLDDTGLPPGANTQTAALAVAEGSMRGVADDGWLFFFDHTHEPPHEGLIGKLCVVEVADGDALVRVLQPGGEKGCYDLESPTAPTLRDARVVWAARVTWIKPR